MFFIKIENEEKAIALAADEFKMTNDRKYVYFYKGNKQVALLKMDNVRAIFQNDKLNIT